MSMVSEQVKELRYKADIYNTVGSVWELNRAEAKRLQIMLRQAADTIESLSAKLQAANRERSANCGGWILCKVRLPEEGQEVILRDYYRNREIGRFGRNEDYQEGFYIGDWFSAANNYLAWHESPEPYHEP